jgi:hypothetical protein
MPQALGDGDCVVDSTKGRVTGSMSLPSMRISLESNRRECLPSFRKPAM